MPVWARSSHSSRRCSAAVAADQFVGLWRLFPDHLFEWTPLPVVARTPSYSAVAQVAQADARCRLLARASAPAAGRPGLGADEPRVPPGARWSRTRTCPVHQRGQRLECPRRVGGRPARGALWPYYIGQAPVFGTQHGQPDAMARLRRVLLSDALIATPAPQTLGLALSNSKPTQGAVAHMHAHHGTASQQVEGQYIAQVEILMEASSTSRVMPSMVKARWAGCRRCGLREQGVVPAAAGATGHHCRKRPAHLRGRISRSGQPWLRQAARRQQGLHCSTAPATVARWDQAGWAMVW